MIDVGWITSFIYFLYINIAANPISVLIGVIIGVSLNLLINLVFNYILGGKND